MLVQHQLACWLTSGSEPDCNSEQTRNNPLSWSWMWLILPESISLAEPARCILSKA